MDLSSTLTRLSAGKVLSSSDLVQARIDIHQVIKALQGKGVMFVCTLRHLQNELHTIDSILRERNVID